MRSRRLLRCFDSLCKTMQRSKPRQVTGQEAVTTQAAKKTFRFIIQPLALLVKTVYATLVQKEHLLLGLIKQSRLCIQRGHWKLSVTAPILRYVKHTTRELDLARADHDTNMLLLLQPTAANVSSDVCTVSSACMLYCVHVQFQRES